MMPRLCILAYVKNVRTKDKSMSYEIDEISTYIIYNRNKYLK